MCGRPVCSMGWPSWLGWCTLDIPGIELVVLPAYIVEKVSKYEKNNTIHNGCWRYGPEVFLVRYWQGKSLVSRVALRSVIAKLEILEPPTQYTYILKAAAALILIHIWTIKQMKYRFLKKQLPFKRFGHTDRSQRATM